MIIKLKHIYCAGISKPCFINICKMHGLVFTTGKTKAALPPKTTAKAANRPSGVRPRQEAGDPEMVAPELVVETRLTAPVRRFFKKTSVAKLLLSPATSESELLENSTWLPSAEVAHTWPDRACPKAVDDANARVPMAGAATACACARSAGAARA